MDQQIRLKTWSLFFDTTGQLLDEYQLRKTSYHYGLSDDIRAQAWPTLLNLWERTSSAAKRSHSRLKLQTEYERIRNGWINAEPTLFDKEMRSAIKTVGKDVLRTERKHPYFELEDSEGLRMLRRILITLSVYDTEVSYMQGMNELVAPLLLTLKDESLTFWCFVKLMPQLRDRLLTLDISPQLSSTADLIQHFDEELYVHIEKITCGHWLFCFRWFLLLFKNEFKMDSILRLWDILFSHHNTAHFEIFFAAALIITNKEQVLACATSDQVLYWAQSVTAKLEISPIIKHARDLSYALCAVVDTLPPKLSALVTQAGQVPPPLVGFVRDQQQFETRPVMNSDLIRRLLQGTAESHTPVRHTTPMFFSCTESPIPIPSQNYLPVITGATPLALAREPELPPPPTATVGSAGGSRIGRNGRPDALVEDKVSNRPVNTSGGYHGNAYHGGRTDGYQGHAVGYPGQYDGNHGNTGQYDGNHGYPGQYDGNHGYTGQYDGNHGNTGQYDGNHGNTGQYDGNHSYPGHYNHGYPIITPPGVTSCPQQPSTDKQLSTVPSHIGVEPNPPTAIDIVAPPAALSSVCDDMWDMRISLHTNDALS